MDASHAKFERHKHDARDFESEKRIEASQWLLAGDDRVRYLYALNSEGKYMIRTCVNAGRRAEYISKSYKPFQIRHFSQKMHV
jgi:hypothetical protein